MYSTFTHTAEQDGRTAYRPGVRAQAALVEALAAIAVVDGGPMPERETATYGVYFTIGYVQQGKRVAGA